MSELTGRTLRNPKNGQNQYYLRRLAGGGATSEVYEAFDTVRSTSMAVKVLKSEVANDERFFRAFEKEAAILKGLSHPNIVRLYEFGRDGGIAFIVMDWVDGSDLKQLITARHAPFPVNEVSTILGPVARALYFAHQMHPAIYHCDVKPANIMIQNKGHEVLLTDFGVARLAFEQAKGGTVPYMAPEQFTSGAIGSGTDVYALGVTVYQMLSGGRVPYAGDTGCPDNLTTSRERIIWQHINQPLPDVRQYNPGLPRAVAACLETALNKDPRQRYSNPLDFERAFEEAKAHAGDTAGIYETVIQRGAAQPANPKARPPRQPVTPAPEAPAKAGPVAIQKGAPYLLGRSGECQGQSIPIPQGGLTIGRLSTCQLRLRERSVSRSHATILRTPRRVYLRDEQSSVGTWLNRQQIRPGQPVPLNHGDIIQIGHELIFEFRVK